MAGDARKGGAKALIDGLSGLIGLGVFVAILAWSFGAVRATDPAPLHVRLAESELALAYARKAPDYRCRSAEQGGDWYVLCAFSGQSGGALFAVLAAAPGKTRVAPLTGKAIQHIGAGFFTDPAITTEPTIFGADTGAILDAFTASAGR